MRLGRLRSRRTSAVCNAPFASMYIDQRGNVRACCWNDVHVLGNITEQRLIDIWRGPATASLRRALEADDLTLGCEFCKWSVDEGRSDLAALRWFSEFAVGDADPPWPQQLELSVSSTCNLQCVMCNGEWSSSIRTQREHLPPLPSPCDDSFFEDLRAFVPYLRKVKFLGGEPFLASETLRIMDLLVQEGATARCHVTTNGTQWSPRVERILDQLPVDVSVSVDAASAETYESIRVGSSWDQLQRNLDRFAERAAQNGTNVSVTFCLMRNNWHEFADFCRQADERGFSCDVNTVTQPSHLTLFQLDVAALESVVAGLEEIDARDGHSFGASRQTWQAELDRVRRLLADRTVGRAVTGVDIRASGRQAVAPFARAEQLRRAPDVARLRTQSEELRVQLVGAAAPVIDLDAAGVVIGGDADALGLDVVALIGRHGAELVDAVGHRHGAVERVETDPTDGDDQIMRLVLADGREIVAVVTPVLADDGALVGSRAHLGWSVATTGGGP